MDKKIYVDPENLRRYSRYAQYRDMRGLTDYKISQYCGIPRSTICDWKAGRFTPRIDTLVKIAHYFGITLSELIGD